MNLLLEKSLAKGHTYSEYREIVSQLLKEGKSTGNDQSEDLLHYSQLNEVRMNRLDKTIKITESIIQKLQKLKRNYIWLVISEGWCGDAAQLLPIINKMVQHSKKIELNIVFRDENEDLMSLFLTNGTKSIPMLIVVDKKYLDVLGRFGPRPKGAKELIQAYKEKHGKVDEQAKTDLQLWYLQDKGISTQNEILEMMLNID